MTAKTANPLLSVVLCTYNPRADYLQRCVHGLKAQTLPRERWEFIVVDNNSQPPLVVRSQQTGDSRQESGDRPAGLRDQAAKGLKDEENKGPRDLEQEPGASASLPSHLPTFPPFTEIDLGWHADARLVVETQQGLSHARRRGFEEAKGELIVNLDDDAVLDPDYLEQVAKLAEEFPFIGVFGCQIRPEFERKPDWPVEEYYGAKRVVDKARWTNDPRHHESNPWGVGSVVRRQVAEAYIAKLAADERFAMIGRTASKLLACEDDDIAMTACDIRLGKGLFPELSLTHLIPEKRMTEEFQCKNAFGHAYSGTMLEFLRFGRRPVRPTLRARLNRAYRLACMKSRRRQQEIARDQGVKEAARDMKQWGWL